MTPEPLIPGLAGCCGDCSFFLAGSRGAGYPEPCQLSPQTWPYDKGRAPVLVVQDGTVTCNQFSQVPKGDTR